MAKVKREKPASIKNIPISNIEPNPHNPRRLFDEEPMQILKESIQKLGILVPVTVYPRRDRASIDVSKDRFVLLDGERRWRCAQELRRPTLPAIVVEQPTETENILTMFHIHNLREGWQLMPTALKLKTLMDKLDEANERKLAQLTKLSVGQIRRCKILLSFPGKFQEMMLAPPTARMKADLFIELQRIRGPALERKFPPWFKRGDAKCIDILVKKYLHKTITAVTDFRKLGEIYRESVRTNQVKKFYKELDRFLYIPDMGIDDIDIPGVGFEKEYKELKRSAKRILNQLRGLEAETIAADEDVVKLLRRLVRAIDSKLSDALVPEPRHVEGR